MHFLAFTLCLCKCARCDLLCSLTFFFLIFSDVLHILLVTFDWLLNFLKVLHSEFCQFERSFTRFLLVMNQPEMLGMLFFFFSD